MHLIMSHHLLCIHDTYVGHMHAKGAPEGVTLLKFEQERLEEQQAAQEQEVPTGGVNVEDLPECPDHQPSCNISGC
jgi:hypothetical protein